MTLFHGDRGVSATEGAIIACFEREIELLVKFNVEPELLFVIEGGEVQLNVGKKPQ